MYIKNFSNDLNLTRQDAINLIILAVFSFLLTVHLLNLNYTHNFKPDSFVYLVNALVYAGMQGNIQNYAYSMFLTPVISILTSLLFRVGIVEKVAIMIVTGAIGIFGEIGLYLLFRTRFEKFLSFLGCILFASFFVIISNWATGGIDLPVCSFAIFTILFMVLAVDKNPKYYILTSIFLILAIFTKYDAFFLIPLLILCYLSKHDLFNILDLALSDREEFKNLAKNYLKSEEFKYILISIFIAIALFILFCELILHYGSNLTFFAQSQESLNGFNNAAASKSNFFYNDKKFYIKHIYDFFYPNISPLLSLIIPFFIAIGGIFGFANLFKSRKDYHLVKDYNTPYFKYLLLAVIIILIPISVLGFKYVSHMVTNIGFLIICVCILSLAEKTNINKDEFDSDILFLAWLIVFAVFFSFITIKGPRYLTIAMPPVVYFVLWSIEKIFNKFKDSNKFKMALVVIAAILMVYSLTITYGDYVLVDERNNTDLQNTYDFLIELDSDYNSKNLSSDYSYGARFGTWTLKKDVKYIKKREMDSSNSDYIISKRDLNLTNYTDIYHSGKIHLYQNRKYN